MTAAPAETTQRAWPVRDESLAHQIVLLAGGVSCNCRGTGSPQSRSYALFAPLGTADACLAAYRDPANHVGEFRP